MGSSLAVSALRLPARVAVGAAPGFMDQRRLPGSWGGNGHGTPDASINGAGQSAPISSAAELWAKTLLYESECWHFWVWIL